MTDRDHMGLGVESNTKATLIPSGIGIINLKVAGDARCGGLLKSILDVSNIDLETMESTESKEEAHARGLNTAGISLHKIMEVGSSTFGAINA